MNNEQQQLSDFVVRLTQSGEPRYEHECRSCGDSVWLDEATHNHYQTNKQTRQGFTMPKCGACWA